MLCFFSPQWLPVRHSTVATEGCSLACIFFVPRFCKFFLDVFIEHLFLVILAFPFFISSDSLGFCMQFLLQCLCQLCNFSGICHFIFLKIFLFFLLSFLLSEPVSVSASIDHFFPVPYLSLHSYFSTTTTIMITFWSMICYSITKLGWVWEGFYAFY